LKEIWTKTRSAVLSALLILTNVETFARLKITVAHQDAMLLSSNARSPARAVANALRAVLAAQIPFARLANIFLF